MSRRLLLWALPLLPLPACQGPAPAGSTPPPPGPAAVGPVGDPSAGRFVTHWDLLKARYEPTFAAEESFAQPCYHTERFRLELLRAGPTGLRAPGEPAAEVLIAVEGSGTLQLADGRTTPLSAGMIAVLPAGARLGLRGEKSDPLRVLAVRERGAVTREGEPLVVAFDELWRAPDPQGPDVTTRWVGGAGRAISLETLEVRGDGSRRGFLPPHTRRRDELVFLLSGGGSLGLANAGNLLAAGSIAGVPAGTVRYYSNNDPQGTLALVVRLPAVDPQNPREDEEIIPTEPDPAKPGAPRPGAAKPGSAGGGDPQPQ